MELSEERALRCPEKLSGSAAIAFVRLLSPKEILWRAFQPVTSAQPRGSQLYSKLSA